MSEPPDVRVLVVEDDAETRGHFARALAGSSRLVLLAAVGTVAEALPHLQGASKPDVLLVDLGLPDGDGRQLIAAARQCSPTTLILVISVFGDEASVVSSVRAGASGYLLKDGPSGEIAPAILSLVDGGSPLSAPVARYVLRLVQSGAEPRLESRSKAAPVPRLTRRELEILEILGRGFNSPEIAEMLQLSVHTVVAHTRSIHRKLEVSSRSAAIFEAVSLGLIQLR